MLISLGFVTVPEDQREAVAQQLSDLAGATRQEKGCLDYRVSRDLDVPGRFTLIETWNSLSEMQAHLAQPQVGKFVQHLLGIGCTDLSVTAYEVGEQHQML